MPLIDEILKYEAGFRPIKKDYKKQLRETARILGVNPKSDPDELLQIVTEGVTHNDAKIRIENGKISSTIKVTGALNENLSDQINFRARSLVNTGVTLVYSFSCLIYDGRGQFKEYHKTLSRFIGMITRKEVEKAMLNAKRGGWTFRTKGFGTAPTCLPKVRLRTKTTMRDSQSSKKFRLSFITLESR